MATGLRLPELNSVTLAGYATREAELFTTSSGTQKATIRMGVSRRYKDAKSGEWKDDNFFINVVVWGQAADRAKERCKKGVALVVEGRLTSRDFDDKVSGQKRTVFEVIANRVQFVRPVSDAAEVKAPKAGGESPVPAAAGEADIEEVPF
jgi:single-strand DNA-binding protein